MRKTHFTGNLYHYIGLFLLAFFIEVQTHADVVLRYDPAGEVSNFDSIPAIAEPGIDASSLSQAGQDGAWFNFGIWPFKVTPSSVLLPHQYMTFNVGPLAPRASLQLSRITSFYMVYRMDDGTKKATIRSSLDNFANDIATVDLKAPFGEIMFPLCSVPALTQQTEFRIYLWDLTNTDFSAGFADFVGTERNGTGLKVNEISNEVCNGLDDNCDGIIDEKYFISGFSEPVDNAPVLNEVKAGSAIPLKFKVTNCAGAPALDLQESVVNVTSRQINCNQNAIPDAIEELASSTSGLINKGNGEYQYNWKSAKTFASSCREVILNLGNGTKLSALFKFK